MRLIKEIIIYLSRIRYYKKKQRDLKTIQDNQHLYDFDTVMAQYDELLERKPLI